MARRPARIAPRRLNQAAQSHPQRGARSPCPRRNGFATRLTIAYEKPADKSVIATQPEPAARDRPSVDGGTHCDAPPDDATASRFIRNLSGRPASCHQPSQCGRVGHLPATPPAGGRGRCERDPHLPGGANGPGTSRVPAGLADRCAVRGGDEPPAGWPPMSGRLLRGTSATLTLGGVGIAGYLTYVHYSRAPHQLHLPGRSEH